MTLPQDKNPTQPTQNSDNASLERTKAGPRLVRGLLGGAAIWAGALAAQLKMWDLVGSISAGLAAGAAVWFVIALYIAPHAEDTRGARFFQRLGEVHRTVSRTKDDAKDVVLEFGSGFPLLSGIVGGFTFTSLIVGPFAPEPPEALGWKVGGAIVGLLTAIVVVGVLDEGPTKSGDRESDSADLPPMNG